MTFDPHLVMYHHLLNVKNLHARKKNVEKIIPELKFFHNFEIVVLFVTRIRRGHDLLDFCWWVQSPLR